MHAYDCMKPFRFAPETFMHIVLIVIIKSHTHKKGKREKNHKYFEINRFESGSTRYHHSTSY